jgi:ring-1,2-phenylacetyl-CoA epoxidase subunit PaaE
MESQFHPLKVSNIVQETMNALSIYFAVPDILKKKFEYRAGQYLTLRFKINEADLRRAYSICTSPLDDEMAVTVKLVKNGIVSRHIHENVNVGDTIDVMPPEGKFTVDLLADQRKEYFLFGAGSGITPLMSLIKTILEIEPMSKVHLYYGNRTIDSIIFKDKIDALCDNYQDQFSVDYILSNPPGTGFMNFLFKKSRNGWTGEKGRIDPLKVKEFLKKYPSDSKNSEYLICGPGDMISSVTNTLVANEIDKNKIHKEHFTTNAEGKEVKAVHGVPAHVIVHLDNEEINIPVSSKTILESLMDAGHEPPYSCQAGACATCMAKVIKGSVEMEACFALEEDEIRQGFVLTCQGHPTTPEVELTYDI